MKFTQFSPSCNRLQAGLAICLILTVATLFATGSTADETKTSSSAQETIGEMHFDGQSYDLTRAHWCAPEDGFESGTTIALRLVAYGETDYIAISGTQTDRDRDRPSIQRVNIAIGPGKERIGGDIILKGAQAEHPAVRIEDGVVHIKAPFRDGAAKARFTLPDEPGFPGYC